jgi:CHASE2 domain-containing sensor protein
LDIDRPATSRPSSPRGGTWDDLPPKRRRFYFCLILLFVLGGLAKIPLQILGLTEIWAGMAVLGLTMAVLIPMASAAWKEFRQRRAQGEEPPPSRVKGSIVIVWAVAAILLWGAAAFAAALEGPLIPLVPVIITATAVMKFRQWQQQKTLQRR